MQTFSLKVKLAVVINGTLMSLQRRLANRRLLFVDQLGEPKILTESEFYLGYKRREIEICEEQPLLGEVPHVRNVAPDLTCFSSSHSKEALRRRLYLEGVTEGQVKLPGKNTLLDKLKQVSNELGEAYPPSISTIRRWYKKFAGKDVVRLVPKHTYKGRSNAITSELEDILQDVIGELYLKRERQKVSMIVGEYLKRIDERNALRLQSDQLKKPCGMTIRRYISRLDPYEVDVHRLGKYAANKKHRVAGEVFVVDGIMDRWEIDHTLLDVLLVDEETGLVIGRPYITIVLDKFSRMIMGYLIHLAAPNTETVLRVIERSILPKTDFLKRFPKVLNEWHAYGMPARIFPDNAAEFHADDLIAGFNELGIEIMYPRSRGPEQKGSVERFFRTLNLGLIHNLPGTTFSNIQEKADYKSEEHACFTLFQLEAVVVKWIVDGYHQTPHRGLNNSTPAQMWAVGERSCLIKLPADPDALECILARRCSVKVHHYGIEVGGYGYHSPELAELRMRMSPDEKISVRYRDEIDHVWVHDRIKNVFLQVPVKDKRLLGLSRELWKAAKKALQSNGNNNPSFEQVYQCQRNLREDVADARASQKLRKRRSAARAKLDKSGCKAPATELLTISSEMDWLDNPLTDISTTFKVSYRRPKGDLEDE